MIENMVDNNMDPKLSAEAPFDMVVSTLKDRIAYNPTRSPIP